jgi:hypothetical protein
VSKGKKRGIDVHYRVYDFLSMDEL